LNHPNIAAIYGLEENGGLTALVMELVEGDDLLQRIARGAIPIDEALPIAKQIADALEAAHEQGIIHRDLNRRTSRSRRRHGESARLRLAKAIDVGSGRSGGAGWAGGLSMSPTINDAGDDAGRDDSGYCRLHESEQAKGRTTDKRSDVWAFGAVLYEMLTGRRAFAGEDITDHDRLRDQQGAGLGRPPSSTSLSVAVAVAALSRQGSQAAVARHW